MIAALDWCAATPAGGAWALHVDGLAVESDPDTHAELLQGTFSLVHATPEGARTSVRPWSEGITGPEGNLVCALGEECVAVDPPMLFDHDGDGEPEVFVRVATERPAGPSTAHGRLWTFRDGAVDVYPPARAWVAAAMRDVDGDGRPDLLTHGHYATEAPGPCSAAAHTALGPLLAAHSLPDGRFSVSDEAARRADREQCPAATADVAGAVVTGPEGGIDAAGTFVRVVCARLWGASAVAVSERLRASERALQRGGRRCAARTPSDVDVLLEWAQQTPPVDLRER